jgi:putative ABC transport system permease protein
MKTPRFQYLKVAKAELTKFWRFYLPLCLILVMGVLSFTVITVFENSFEKHISGKSKAITGGSAVVSGNEPFSEALQEELSSLFQISESSHKTSLFSMVQSASLSRLASVIGVDVSYPLEGSLEGRENGSLKNQISDGLAVIGRDLATQLQVDIGGNVQIGTEQFRIADIIANDSSASEGFVPAPKVYISEESLLKTDLIKFGSRINYNLIFNSSLDDLGLKSLISKNASSLFSKYQVKVKHHQSASLQTQRFTAYLADFLSLVTLIGLIISGVGSFYFVRQLCQRNLKNVGILRSLGASPLQAVRIITYQLIFLAAMSGLLSLLISMPLAEMIPLLLPALNLVNIDPSYSVQSILTVVIIAVTNTLIFALPIITKVLKVDPSVLLHHQSRRLKLNKSLAWWGVIVAYYVALGFWLTSSWWVALIFIGIIAVVLGLLFGLISTVIRITTSEASLKNLGFDIAKSFIRNNPTTTIVSVIAVTLTISLLNIPYQMRNIVSEQIGGIDDDPVRPELFLFDIQPEQLQQVEDVLASDNKGLDFVSPLIRGRLVAINSLPISDENLGVEGEFSTREQQRANQLKSRVYNLSARGSLASSESLEGGVYFKSDFDPDSNQLPEISLETRFAKRLNIELGDELVFDIDGVLISGVVTSFRKVNWASFQPNFFVVFQGGVFEDAPRTYLGAVAGVSFDEKQEIQRRIVSKMPNISVIDVSETVRKVAELSGQIGNALSIMSLLVAISGLLVLLVVINQSAQDRLNDYRMLRVLGVEMPTITQVSRIEFYFTLAVSCALAAIISVVAVFAITELVFESPLSFDVSALSMSIALCAVVSFGGCLSAQRFLRYYLSKNILKAR